VPQRWFFRESQTGESGSSRPANTSKWLASGTAINTVSVCSASAALKVVARRALEIEQVVRIVAAGEVARVRRVIRGIARKGLQVLAVLVGHELLVMESEPILRLVAEDLVGHECGFSGSR